MDEKLIQRVLEIEKQAQEIHEHALAEALNLPVKAESEAQAIIDKARSEAEEEARKMIAAAGCRDDCDQILAEAEEKIQQAEQLGKLNFERAVRYTLARVLGRE